MSDEVDMSWFCSNGCRHEFASDTDEPQVCQLCELREEVERLTRERDEALEKAEFLDQMTRNRDAWRATSRLNANIASEIERELDEMTVERDEAHAALANLADAVPLDVLLRVIDERDAAIARGVQLWEYAASSDMWWEALEGEEE